MEKKNFIENLLNRDEKVSIEIEDSEEKAYNKQINTLLESIVGTLLERTEYDMRTLVLNFKHTNDFDMAARIASQFAEQFNLIREYFELKHKKEMSEISSPSIFED